MICEFAELKEVKTMSDMNLRKFLTFDPSSD